TCQIVGERRIGKTSLLHHVMDVATDWNPKSVVAYVDLQDAQCATAAGWLHLVSRRFRWSPAMETLAQISERLDEMIETEELHPVLCLDEFEQYRQRRSEFAEDFFANLRACAGKGMSILTASQRQLSELTDRGDPTSPFFNVFSTVRLDRFT